MRKSIIFIILFLVVAFLFIAGDKIFGIVFPPKVVNILPQNDQQNIAADSEIIVNFDKPVARQEISFTILPEVLGQWEFKDPMIENHLFKTSIFSPAVAFEPNTDYQVQINNIQGIAGSKSNSFSLAFSTEKKENGLSAQNSTTTTSQATTTLVKTVFHWQQHNLSCEAASLKMALSAKDVTVSENEIMNKIGFDSTPHQNGIWGDPDLAFVGNIDGKMCSTGYGVHWNPMAKAAQNWRPAEAFSNWTLPQLINELSLGNPVVMWGTLPLGTIHDYFWYTLTGKQIKTYRETHVRLIVGFVGPAENPTKIIMNDPLAGKLYWDTAYFLKNWQSFNFSGVVVR
jgi:uncharacterized protein YvpB